MSKEEILNELIIGSDTNKISDGYHTFGELYELRIVLYVVMARIIKEYVPAMNHQIWRSKKHSDNTEYEGWFLLGIFKDRGSQITYHLPIEEWEKTNFAETLEKAPLYDGHTSKDVLDRLASL